MLERKVDEDFDAATTPDSPEDVGATTVAAVAPAPVDAVPVTAAVVGKRKRNLPERYTGIGPSKKKAKGQIAEGRLKLLNGVRRKANTSLKGHKYNIYMNNQGTYYDTERPSVLVIPLLSFEEIIDWGK